MYLGRIINEIIGIFSPMIDEVGNSTAAMHFLESLSEQYQLSVF